MCVYIYIYIYIYTYLYLYIYMHIIKNIYFTLHDITLNLHINSLRNTVMYLSNRRCWGRVKGGGWASLRGKK